MLRSGGKYQGGEEKSRNKTENSGMRRKNNKTRQKTTEIKRKIRWVGGGKAPE